MNKDDGNFVLVMILLIGGGVILGELVARQMYQTLQSGVAVGMLLVYGIMAVLIAFSISNEHSFRRGDYQYLMAVYLPLALGSFYFVRPESSGLLDKTILTVIYLLPLMAIVRAWVASRRHEWY